MESLTHLVSTKVLAPKLVKQLKLAGLSLSSHNFIQTIIRIPSPSVIHPLNKHIVLTSKSAVSSWVAIAQRYQITLSDYFIFCTDQGTRQEAWKHDLTIAGTASDAAALADVIEANEQVKSVTFVCSNIRRDELPSKLRAKGIEVKEIIGYHADRTPIKFTEPYQAVLFFSPSGVDSFLSTNIISPVCFCIGATTASHAAKAGFKEVQISELATPESVVEKVIHYYSKNSVHA